MTCDAAIESIPLYFYGELVPDEEEKLEQHLEACGACRAELEKHRALAAALESHQAPIPAGLLAECRHDLMRSVYTGVTASARAERPSAWRNFREGFALLFANLWRVRQPAGALALIALGYFAARINAPAPATVPSSDAVISTVRSVQPDPSGGVQISLDETRRRIVSGNRNDSNIQRLLLAAARDENNPAVRVESVDILKDDPVTPEVRSVLLWAAMHDPNPGVRLKSLEGLKPMAADAEVRKTLSQVLLTDSNPGVRIQAIDMLTERRDDSVVGVLQHVVQREDNNYVRLRCEKALKDMKASVGTF